jgi:glycosyltransferase involved in cell wall biosynthesis
MTKLPLSVFIIAHNEGDRIRHTIESVSGWVDEVIVIDGGSNDNTVAASEAAGAKTLYHEWKGYGLQKRFGGDQCRNTWLLNLDADEAVSPELKTEIHALFAGGLENHAGYRLRICNMLPGEAEIPRRTQVNEVLRLYNKTLGRFSDSPVHDSVITDGKVATLKGSVYHRSYRSYAHAIDKMNRYSSMQAEDMIQRGQSVSAPRIMAEFFGNFIKAYFFRLYMFRGVRGFNYAMLYAFSRFTRLAKWYEETHQDKNL